MVGKAVGPSDALAPPSIYDAYPLTRAPPPPLERVLSQQRLASDDAMAVRRMRELFERVRADNDDDDGAYDELHDEAATVTSPQYQRQRAERRSATMFSRFGKFTGEVYETKERSRMINVLKRRSRTPAGGAATSAVSSTATASSKFTADDVLRAGMLTKQGSWRRNWKTRFFILRRDYPSLSYYKSEEKLELLGSIPITGDSLVLDKSAPGGHAPFRFQLRTDAVGAALLLETETRDNQQRWMDACQELVDALRAEKFRQSTLRVDRDPTTARQSQSQSADAARPRPSMGNSSTLRASVSHTNGRAPPSPALLSASAPSGSMLKASTPGRIRGTNQKQGSSRDLRRAADLTVLDESDLSSDDDSDNQTEDNHHHHDHTDDDDDDIWATGRSQFLVVLDESTRQQNQQQIHKTQSQPHRRASLLAAQPLVPNPTLAFDLVLELALGRSSKLLTKSEATSDKLRCCVKVVGYAATSKRSVELGTTDNVRIAAAASSNPDGSASPVRVAFSVVLQADLDKFDQLRFTVYRLSSSSASSRSTVGIGRCFVDEAFKTLGAPRLVALAEKSSSFPDILATSGIKPEAARKAGSAHNLQPLDSNAIHLVVQAFPSVAPQQVLPTTGVDMATTKYLLPTTLSTDATSSPREVATPNHQTLTRFGDNGSFLTSSSESVAPPNPRHIVVDEILRAPKATFALPLAFLEFLEETALERTRVLQKQVEADGDKETAAMLAFELEFYRKKLEEYLRQRQFLMKQEKKLLDEATTPQIFQFAAEQVLTMAQKAAAKSGESSGSSALEGTASSSSASVELVAPFKRSTYKSLDLWQFVPTNMQDQFLYAHQPSHVADGRVVAQPFVWHTMTMGCPAAHTKGFASGGFPLTASVLEATRPSASASASASASYCYSDDDLVASDNELFARERVSAPFETLRRRSRTSLTTRTSHSTSSNPANDGSDSVAALKQRLELKDRLDIVASQALSAAVACLTASLDLAVAGSETHRLQLANATKCGFLVHFESLLSTQGKEVGMLEDFAAAAKWLRTVFVQFRRHNATGSTSGSAGQYFSIKTYSPPERRGVAGGTGLAGSYASAVSLRDPQTQAPPPYVLVTMGVTDAQLAVLPPLLATGKPLRLRCVLFTQGVNEKQSLVHALKSQTVKVQDRINRENLEELKEIYGLFRRVHGGDDGRVSKTHSDPCISRYTLETLDDLLTQIEQHVCDSSSQFKKNVALLTDTSDFCRELGGARVTCCKSGKDRTAMSVTLEQTRLCCSRLKVAPGQAKALCATMRLWGVRRKNVFLNTKSSKFAFNEMQRKMLPDCYKPPAGTYKSGTT